MSLRDIIQPFQDVYFQRASGLGSSAKWHRNEPRVRKFLDPDGGAWVATVRSEAGLDFKGRHHLYFHPEGAEDQGVELLDVKWNSQETAERTLATMSGVELRRRLRSARGRSALGGGSRASVEIS